MSLADILKQSNIGMKDESSGIAQTLRAKSGKARAAGTTPTRTQVAEKMQVQEGRRQLGEVAADKAVADESTKQRELEQKQRQELAEKDLEQQQVEMNNDLNRREDALFGDLERNRTELDTMKGIAKTEQLGFLLGLRDNKYTQQLQDVGRKQRLESAADFKIALQSEIFKEYQGLFEENLEFGKALNADKREFAKQLAEMDLATAMEIMKADIKAANTQAIWTGLGSAGSAAASADWKKINSPSGSDSDFDKNQYNANDMNKA